MVPDSKKMDMPYVVEATAKWVRDLFYSQHTENQRHDTAQLYNTQPDFRARTSGSNGS